MIPWVLDHAVGAMKSNPAITVSPRLTVSNLTFGRVHRTRMELHQVPTNARVKVRCLIALRFSRVAVRRSRWWMTVQLLTFGAGVLLLLACSHEAAPIAATSSAPTVAHEPVVAPHDAKHAAPSKSHSAHDVHSEAKPGRSTPSGKKLEAGGYAVPFVWETSRTDPLAGARAHLKKLLASNLTYADSRVKLAAKKGTSAPRGTVLTCSDASVQLHQMDVSPENDTFVVRNWGNLFEPSLGTVSYGIEHLATPVLVIVGHTGCEAVAAAMNGTKFSKPLQAHLSKLKVKSGAPDQPESARLDAAVTYNVNRQVAKAVERFKPLVQTGKLTVVGAIFDPHNALKRGAGRLSIINVNSVTDVAAMRAFETAITTDDKFVMHTSAENPEAAPSATEPGEAAHAAEPAHAESGHEHPVAHSPEAHPIAEAAHGQNLGPTVKKSVEHVNVAAPREVPHALPRVDQLEASLVDRGPGSSQHADEH